MSGVEVVVGRAHGLVAQLGSPIERLFLETLLQERAGLELLEAFAAEQRDDGALAPEAAKRPAAEAATALALERLDALGLLDHPVPERACGFLAQGQHADGGFGQPQDPEAQRLAETGRLAGLLGRSPFARPSWLRASEGFLARRWKVELVQGPSYGPILAFTSLLTQVPSELADEALQWCGRELERGFRLQSFGPLATARVFLRARAKALPGAKLEAGEIVTALITAQQPDGGFAPDDEPGETPISTVPATLEAVEALLRLSPQGP